MTTFAPDLSTSPVEDRTPAAVERLRAVTAAPQWGRMIWSSPSASAAFSRRDSRLPGFTEAADAVRMHGFAPFIRPVGGRLAAYDEHWLVIDLFGRTADPRPGTTARFRLFTEAITMGLRELGVDARIGAVPGEYCPGEWSINAGGRTKLVGTGQRLTRDGFLVTAVIAVEDPAPARRAMAAGYGALRLPFDDRSVGSIVEERADIGRFDAVEAIGRALAHALPLGHADAGFDRRILEAWDPR